MWQFDYDNTGQVCRLGFSRRRIGLDASGGCVERSLESRAECSGSSRLSFPVGVVGVVGDAYCCFAP